MNDMQSKSFEKDSFKNNDDNFLTFSLDLSSIAKDDNVKGTDEFSEAVLKIAKESSSPSSHSPQSLYNSTVDLIESNAITVENGIQYLEKIGKHGYGNAYIYIGKLYSDETREIYNPAIAYEYFSKAARFGLGAGYYHIALCYHTGLGCQRSETLAYDYFLKGAEVEDSDCICALGMCREFGIGCDPDYVAAVKYYSAAAEKDNVTAISNLGGCYLYGHGIAMDPEKALELFEKAAEMGSETAVCRVGDCYEKGIGCEKNEITAFNRYSDAATNGNAIALYRLALCYKKGIGTEQNFTQAYKHIVLSAKAGYPEAMYESALMSMNGIGTKKDPVAAYKMLSLAANAGYPQAHFELGNCHFEGIGTVKNRDAAFLKYMSAYEFDSKNANAAFKIGLCKLKGLGTPKNEQEAFDWFCRGAELGSADAAYMKGECFFYGIGITQELSVASRCFEKAVTLAEETKSANCAVSAILALANTLENGYGGSKEVTRALKLYRQAADEGNAEALYRAGMLMTVLKSAKSDASPRTLILRSARLEYAPAMLSMGIFAEEGRGIAQNVGDAQKWYERVIDSAIVNRPGLYDFPERFYSNQTASSEAKIEAHYRLGMILSSCHESAKSYINAFEHISMAASLSYEEAQIEVARFTEHSNDLKNYYESETFVNARNYYPDRTTIGSAMNRLGNAYFDGKTLVNKNPTAAARCYKIAAEIGDVDACYSYGWCLRHGVGVKENDAECLKWLKLAADKGHVHAAYSYGLCCEEGAGTGIKNLREARSYYRRAAVAGHVEAGKRYMSISSEQ